MILPFRSFLTLPPIIRGNIRNTWAFDTMTRRIWEEILPRIFQENAQYPDYLRKLQELIDRKKEKQLRDINDGQEDNSFWNNNILSAIPKEERNWLDAPWLVSEFYFYRRIVEAFNYFQSRIDMFAMQKRNGLIESLPFIVQMISSVEEVICLEDWPKAIQLGLFTSLWGNKLDLSLWPKHSSSSLERKTDDNSKESLQTAGTIATIDQFEKIRRYILDDQTDEVIRYLLQQHSSRLKNDSSIKPSPMILDIVVDNAGYELVCDFILAYILLQLNIVKKVRFHTKIHPTFVSNTTTFDCFFTVNYLRNDVEDFGIRNFGNCLQNYIESESIEFLEDFFWCQPVAFWDMPKKIQDRIEDSVLVIIKGDANYRRALGDRQWNYQTPAKDVLSYWPVPVCALRTLKAELACGISPEKQLIAEQEDPRWLVSGRWAVVQFCGL